MYVLMRPLFLICSISETFLSYMTSTDVSVTCWWVIAMVVYTR